MAESQLSELAPALAPRSLYPPKFSLQIAIKRRADERTRTADLPSLRVIIQVLQGFASSCKSRIYKAVSLLSLALCCTVLRSRWCQSGVNITLTSA